VRFRHAAAIIVFVFAVDADTNSNSNSTFDSNAHACSSTTLYAGNTGPGRCVGTVHSLDEARSLLSR